MTLHGLWARLQRLEHQAFPADDSPWDPPAFPEGFAEEVMAQLRQHGQLSDPELTALLQARWQELETPGEGRQQRRVLRNIHTGAVVHLPPEA